MLKSGGVLPFVAVLRADGIKITRVIHIVINYVYSKLNLIFMTMIFKDIYY